MKRLIVLLLIFALALAGCTKKTSEVDKPQSPYVEEAYNLEVSDGTIYGTLMLAKNGETDKLVIIQPGSGPTDRNGNNPLGSNTDNLKLIAQGLADNGISSIRFDKRGIQESAEAMIKEEDLRFEQYVEDVKEWVQKVREDGRFNSVFLLGHSEGALITAIAATQAQVEGYISISGIADRASDILRIQLSTQPVAVTSVTDKILDSLDKGELYKEVPNGFEALFRPSVQPYLISWFKYDPKEVIKDIKAPILIIQGDNDLQVGLENAQRLAEAAGIEPIVFKGMNHILKDAPKDSEGNIATYEKKDLPLTDGLIKAIADFVESNSK